MNEKNLTGCKFHTGGNVNEIVEILMERDGLSLAEAREELGNARERVRAGEDIQTVLEEEFGLEPDHVWSLV